MKRRKPFKLMIKIARRPLIIVTNVLLWFLVAYTDDDNSVKYYTEAAFSIEPLPSLTKDSVIHFERSGHYRRYRYEYYAVAGYKQVPDLKVSLDSFVCANLIEGYEKYDSYSLTFYQKTDYINFDNFKKDRKNFSRFFDSDPYVLCGYTFKHGKFKAGTKYHESIADKEVFYTSPCSASEGHD
jgi:hypothetical protein